MLFLFAGSWPCQGSAGILAGSLLTTKTPAGMLALRGLPGRVLSQQFTSIPWTHRPTSTLEAPPSADFPPCMKSRAQAHPRRGSSDHSIRAARSFPSFATLDSRLALNTISKYAGWKPTRTVREAAEQHERGLASRTRQNSDNALRQTHAMCLQRSPLFRAVQGSGHLLLGQETSPVPLIFSRRSPALVGLSLRASAKPVGARNPPAEKSQNRFLRTSPNEAFFRGFGFSTKTLYW